MTRPLLPPAGSPARRGSIVIYAVILIVFLREVVDVATTLGTGAAPNWGSAVRIVVTLVLLYGLYRGYLWARMLLIVLGMIALAVLLAAIMSRPWDGASAAASVIAAAYLAIVVILAFSPAVRAYEDWRQEG